ncbi:Glutathione synthetase large chain [Botrytis cinerea]
MTSSYPPEISAKESEQLLVTIKDWSIAHGLAVRPPPAFLSAEADPHGVLATTAPVTLFPSPFPRICFEQAKSVQKAYNLLYASISQDEAFLEDIVQEILEVDDFIAELWRVHLKVKSEGYVQNLSLGLFRSDYMVHQETSDATPTIKQVEFNTIASSFGGLSSQTSQLHKYLSLGDYSLFNKDATKSLDLPENTSIYPNSDYDLCTIFLVQTPERNIFDQRHLEYELQKHGVPVFRLAFSEVLGHTTIAQTSKRELLYSPPSNPSKKFEVAVVYLRAGYGPQDYTTESAWEGRFQIERSNAIKCPSILTQLAGAKKVQQVLATPRAPSTPSMLDRFVKTNNADLVKLEDTFTNIFPLDESPAGLEARKIAVDPERCNGYVLKPQREGGVLLEIIYSDGNHNPPPVHNMILRNGVIEKGGVICELGIYGTCLWDQTTSQVLHNEEAGYLLRTKGDKSEEGGVAAGFGSMDSVALV